MRYELPPQDTPSLKWDNTYKGARIMNLDFPVSVPSIPADDKAKAPVVAGTRKLADHPPGEWVERMKAKYGPMPVSENARKVLDRRYLKKDPAGERMGAPEETR